MEVRLLKHWKGWKPGKVFCEMPRGAGEVLIKRGSAEEVKSEPAKQPRSKSRAK